jgi:hypothetical protein
MSNIGGNYNFGVWNPPTSIDSVRYSEQLNANTAIKLNSLQKGKEEGIKQSFGVKWPKFEDPDIDVINYINNIDVETFTQLLREGWKGEPTPTPEPLSTFAVPPNIAGDIDLTRPILPPGRRGFYCVVVFFLQASLVTISDDPNYNYYLKVTNSGSYEPTNSFYTFTHIYEEKRGVEPSTIYTESGSGTSQWQQGRTTDFISSAGPAGLGGSEDEVYRILDGYSSESRRITPYFTEIYTRTYNIIYSTCSVSPTPTPPPAPSPIIYRGNGSSPPPRKKMSNCCDCNTIATIVESQSIAQLRAQLRAQEKLVESLKDHIDKRALEIIIKDLEHLKALDFEQFLKAILQRVNESEANLWNGVQR